MRRLLLFSLVLLSAFTLSAQTAGNERPTTGWKTGGWVTVMAGQSGTRNWAPAGSEKFTLSLMGNINLWANRKWGRNSWDNNLELAYAFVKTTSQGFRKIDDKFDFFSKYSYSLARNTGVGVVGALRTQLTNGYDYSEAQKRRTSGFFAPAYLTLSPGVQFKTTNEAFSIHVGPAARWVIVTNAPYSFNYQGGIKPDGTTEVALASMYGVDPGSKVRYTTGAFASLQFKKEIVKNVLWRSRADINADQSDLGATDVYWTNTITMTVNKWLKVNYNFDLYKDNDVRMWGPAKNETRTQLKSLLGVGLGVSF
jgi:hypothetical protein